MPDLDGAWDFTDINVGWSSVHRPALEAIRREVYGADYPATVSPDSFVSLTELKDCATDLKVGRGKRLLDIGCGAGGPGLWVAKATGSKLTATDPDDFRKHGVTHRADINGMKGRVEFKQGDFEHLPCGDGSIDGAMSIDAIHFTQDKQAAFDEVARVLRSPSAGRPGGRFAFTTWEWKSQPPTRAPQVSDYRPLLQAAGFKILRYETTTDWEARMTAFYDLAIARADSVAAEIGLFPPPPEKIRQQMQDEKALLPYAARRIFVVVEKI